MTVELLLIVLAISVVGNLVIFLFFRSSPNKGDSAVREELRTGRSESAQAARDKRSLCWKIEQFHREVKQITGIERCQCRKQRAQRNHIGCAILVWVHLNRLAHQTGKTIYQLKFGLLSDYMRQQLKQPSIRMSLA